VGQKYQTVRWCERKTMRFRIVGCCVLILVALSFAVTAKADKVTIDGSVAFWDHNYGIPPYGGALNGVSKSFYCVDFSSTIAPPYSWDVTIMSLTGSDFTHTKLGNKTDYLAMAWLITQMVGQTNLQKAKDQYAIWSFSGGPNPYGTNNALVTAALAAATTFNGTGWEILTPIGSQGQEFLIYVGVPEPATLLMLLLGLGVLMVSVRKKGTVGTYAI
jgi:hypothetical protein